MEKSTSELKSRGPRRSARELLQDEQGLTTVEYIIVLCLICVVGFGVWKEFGETVKDHVTSSTEQIDLLPDSAP